LINIEEDLDEKNKSMSNKLEQAYILDWDNSHLLDLDYDAFLVKFSGWENTICLSLTKEYNLPERIEFDAIFDTLKHTDFPINNVRWPIFSQRAISRLSRINSFRHKNWDKSLYQPHPRMNNRVTSISKLVLTEPKNDLPPIFRLSAYSTALFVSAEARKLLEKEGIKGIKFQDINTYQC
jgi:hypothetical protein